MAVMIYIFLKQSRKRGMSFRHKASSDSAFSTLFKAIFKSDTYMRTLLKGITEMDY